jgi:hypothetical protein
MFLRNVKRQSQIGRISVLEQVDPPKLKGNPICFERLTKDKECAMLLLIFNLNQMKHTHR